VVTCAGEQKAVGAVVQLSSPSLVPHQMAVAFWGVLEAPLSEGSDLKYQLVI